MEKTKVRQQITSKRIKLGGIHLTRRRKPHTENAETVTAEPEGDTNE